MGNTATMHNGVNVEELVALVNRVKVNLACNGTPKQIQELHAQVLRTSPIYDTLWKPVDIRVTTG